MHYQSQEGLDTATLQVHDTFMWNGTLYEVERVFDDGPFMCFTPAPIRLVVVSQMYEGTRLYQVTDFSGDWEGCVPMSDTVEGALFSELARHIEFENEPSE